MLGGVSQMDTFDPKQGLEKFDNTVMDWSKEKNTDQPNLFAGSFRRPKRSLSVASLQARCGLSVRHYLSLSTEYDYTVFYQKSLGGTEAAAEKRLGASA
jgi:hypothetical protein